MKKTKQTLIILASLLLAASLTMTACNKPKDPSAETDADTAITDTGADTTPSTNKNPDSVTTAPNDEETTDAVTDPETDPETDSTPETDPAPETTPGSTETEPDDDVITPIEMTSEELKTLLSAAFEADKQITDATGTIKTLMNGEELSTEIITQKGEDFYFSSSSMGSLEELIVLGDQAYYLHAYDDGEVAEQYAYLVKLTAEQKVELFGLYIGEENEEENDALYDGILAGTLTGTRNPDGTVSISTTEVDESLVTLLMGEEMAGATLSFDFTISPEGLLTFMRFTVGVPADMMFGMEMVITTEMTTDYSEPTIVAPADTSAYVESSFEEVFYGVPAIDNNEAASVGLPVDGDNYVIGGPDAAYDAEAQFWFLDAHGYYYEEKTFVLYGFFSEDDWGDYYVTVANDIDFWAIVPDGMDVPEDGSYVKMTATYGGYGMIVTAIETMDAPAEATEHTMYVIAAALNVRSTPDSSVEDNVIGYFSYGDPVVVLETGLGDTETWCKVKFDCEAGCAYVSVKYLSEIEPEELA